MSYSNLYLRNNQKIPVIFVLLILLFILVFFVKIFTNSSTPIKASKIELKRIEISNLTPNQTTIFWETDEKETGWLLYGKKGESLSQIVYDDRDIVSKKNQYRFHYVTLKNLIPETTYRFQLIANNKLIRSNSIFTFTTPKQYIVKSNIRPAYGKVIKSNNQPLESAIVILELKNSFPLTAITKSTGEWLIPMYAIYQKDSLQQKTLSSTDSITMDVISEDGQNSRVLASLNNLSPLPQTLVIGNNYNFLTESSVLGLSESKSQNIGEKSIYISYPQEGAMIPGFTPIIKGKSPPNTEILVTTQGNNRTFAMKTFSNKEGIWEIKMKEKLLIGKYILTAEITEKNGNTVSDQRTFLIIANEGNDAKVLGVASGSPTLSLPSPSPTLIPTKPIVFNTPISSLSATEKPPVPGSNHIISTVGAISLIILGIGILLAF